MKNPAGSAVGNPNIPAGKLMAEAIAGDAERFDMFAAVKHRNFPGGPLRTPALVLAMAYYKLRDRMG